MTADILELFHKMNDWIMSLQLHKPFESLKEIHFDVQVSASGIYCLCILPERTAGN